MMFSGPTNFQFGSGLTAQSPLKDPRFMQIVKDLGSDHNIAIKAVPIYLLVALINGKGNRGVQRRVRDQTTGIGMMAGVPTARPCNKRVR
jgi:hypothetical protein